MSRRFSAAVVGVAIVSSAAPCPAADLIGDLAPGHWASAPGTRLETVFPKPAPPGSSGQKAVMSAWNGATLDTKRNRVVVHGGGHGDYAGNEIYVFDLDELKWSRIWGPSANADIPAVRDPVTATYRDGAPRAVHTYAGLHYLPAQDKLYRAGGSIWSGAGGGSRTTWLFDFDAGKWLRRADHESLGVSQTSAFDPVTGKLFGFSDTGRFAEYDPAADKYATRHSMGGIARGEDMMAAIDAEARIFVAAGNDRMIVYDIARDTVRNQETKGPRVVREARGPGLAYDPALKRIVGWAGGTSVYSLDTKNWEWTEHPAAASNTVTPTPKTRVGVYGRWLYIPKQNAYFLVNATDEDVFFYRGADAHKG
ncbi:MAG: hypothetical protein WD069_20595 [Planctomycetales bacterium]